MSERRPVPPHHLSDSDYERLLEFRTGLRRFLAWSRNAAAGAGLPPSQHQLLLAIRGHPDRELGPTITEVADYLLIKRNSAAELATRAERAGLVRRLRDKEDSRAVRLRLTRKGELKIQSLTAATLEELERLGPRLVRVWQGLDER
jgi:DNA-binding MarR family transcriptional regulator